MENPPLQRHENWKDQSVQQVNKMNTAKQHNQVFMRRILNKKINILVLVWWPDFNQLVKFDHWNLQNLYFSCVVAFYGLFIVLY